MGGRLVLVTGATGLVGNNIVRQLLARGDAVRVLVRAGRDERPLDGLDLDHATGDLCDEAAVRRAVRGVAGVIHAGGLVHLGWSKVDQHRAVNVEGTRHVAQAARDEGVRMIHVSSCDALAVRSIAEPADESMVPATEPQIPYPRFKWLAERVVLEEVARGLDAVIVNPSFMLGPWDWKPSSGRMLLEVWRGHGRFAPKGWFSICDVRDAAAAIIVALDRGRRGERYILAGETMTYYQAWRMFAQVSGGPRPWTPVHPAILRVVGALCDGAARLTGQEGDINSASIQLAILPKAYTSAKAAQELAYHSRPPQESAQAAWAWFQEHGYVGEGGRR